MGERYVHVGPHAPPGELRTPARSQAQVGVTSSLHQDQDQLRLPDLLDQHPVGPDVAVPQSSPVGRERMIPITDRQRLATSKHLNHREEGIHVEAASSSPLEVLPAFTRDDDVEHYRSRSSRKSATLP